MSRSKPWERNDRESPQVYAYFVAFQAMAPWERNYKALAKQVGKTHQYIRNLASDYDWPRRIEAYDRHIQEEREQKLIRAREKIVDKMIGKADDVIDNLLRIASGLKPKASAAEVAAARTYLDRIGVIEVKELNLSGGLTLEGLINAAASEEEDIPEADFSFADDDLGSEFDTALLPAMGEDVREDL